MSNSTVQIQWSLDATAAAIYSVARGAFVAASGDDVQPLAILACEKFGGTLPMSPEAREKIEATVLPTPEPAVIRFVKGLVGYNPHDCVSYLGRNDAGVRFLALAVPLVTTLDLFDCAKSVVRMMQRSAFDPTMIPTVREMKRLLASLEPRCLQSRFANLIVNSQTILRNDALPFIQIGQDQHHERSNTAESFLSSAPSPQMIEALVDTFRQLGRIGESSIIGVTITVGSAAAWIIAFITWNLGVPPLIRRDDSRILYQERQTEVIVMVPNLRKDLGRQLEIHIHHSIGNPTQLLGLPSNRHGGGMGSVECYGEWVLREFGYHGDRLRRMLQEALSRAIPKVLSVLELADLSSLRWPHQQHGPPADHLNRCQTKPLPGIHRIREVYGQLLGIQGEAPLVDLPGDARISDLPLVGGYIESLREKCTCAQCTQAPTEIFPAGCAIDCLYRHIAYILMDIFALSLFYSPKPLLVKFSMQHPMPHELYMEIIQILKTGSTESVEPCDPSTLLTWARFLVRHVFEDEDGEYIMTSDKGQVVYPTSFESYYIEKNGYLALTALPGILQHGGDTYSTVMAPFFSEDFDGAKPSVPPAPNVPTYPTVSVPLNLFPDHKVLWKIHVHSDTELRIQMCVRSQEGRISEAGDPIGILQALGLVFIPEACPHHSYAKLVPPDAFCAYSSPEDSHSEAYDTTSFVDIVGVDKADDLRFFSLTRSNGPVVLRRDTCVKCCLAFCRQANAHLLIL